MCSITADFTPSAETVNPVLDYASREVRALARAFVEQTFPEKHQRTFCEMVQEQVNLFPPDEQIEALARLLDGCPGFRSFVAEWSVRETAYLDCERAAQAVR
jgi:hypothetical protein